MGNANAKSLTPPTDANQNGTFKLKLNFHLNSRKHNQAVEKLTFKQENPHTAII
jgi:hypothetical protein